MTSAALKGLLGRKLRTVLTALAIVLGVAMVSGAYVITDTMLKASDSLKTASYSGADAVVTGRTAFNVEEGNAGKTVRAVPESLVGKLRGLPQVAEAQGEISDTAKITKRNGKIVNSSGAPPFAVGFDGTTPAAQRLSPFKVRAGRFPVTTNEVAIDVSTARKQHYHVGDTVGIVALGPAQRFRISGLVTFGGVESIGNASAVVLSLRGAQQLFDKPGQVDTILLGSKPGATRAQLEAAVRPLLPPTAIVESAQKQDRFDLKGLDNFLKIIRIALIAFGGISLFVGAFIIFNTLSITVAQRAREFGLLRMIGASRRQVLGSVVLEAVVIGLLASVIGIGAGIGLAAGLQALFKSLGLDLPSTGMVFELRTLIVSLAIGILVTTVAGLAPALRATRVAPVEALREGTMSGVRHQSRTAFALGLLTTGVGVLLVCYGVFAGGLSAGQVLGLMGAGCVLLFIGVAMFSPRVARPLASAIGRPFARFGGAPGSLARENAMRNPGRTATTAAALMIGIALVTFVAVLSSGLKHSFGVALDKQVNASWFVTSQDGFSPFQPAVLQRVRQTPGVTAATSVVQSQVKAFGKKDTIDGIDPTTAGALLKYDWKQGSHAVLRELDGNGAIVTKDYAKDHHLTVGSTFTVQTPTSGSARFTVKGIQKPPAFNPLGLGKIEIAQQRYNQLFTDHRVRLVLARGDLSKSALQASLGTQFPDAKLQTHKEFVDSVNKQMDQFFMLLYVLLALSVIVSLFGIVNTLVLSVFERTRELGMLRAVGMTRRQVRRMIRSESIVTALIGGVLGMVIGVFLSAIVTGALSDEGVAFNVPVGTLIVFLIVAMLAGVVAAILPARRASRLNVLEALQYE